MTLTGVGKLRNRQSGLDVFQLRFIHPEVVSQFMEHSLFDFVANLGLIGADRLDILLSDRLQYRCIVEAGRLLGLI